jgi:hypothetical protein
MNSEHQWIWKEAVVIWFEILSRNLPGGEGRRKITKSLSQDGRASSQCLNPVPTECEPGMPATQLRCFNKDVQLFLITGQTEHAIVLQCKTNVITFIIVSNHDATQDHRESKRKATRVLTPALWRWIVSFTLRLFYHRLKNTGTRWIGWLQRWGIHDGDWESPCQESNYGLPARRQ